MILPHLAPLLFHMLHNHLKAVLTGDQLLGKSLLPACCWGQNDLISLGQRLKSQLMLRRHVIIETNKTTARIFPEVPDCETPEFWDHMEKLIVLNKCATSLLRCSLCGAGFVCLCGAMH